MVGLLSRQTSANTSYNTTVCTANYNWCKRLIQISPSPSPSTSTLSRSCLKLTPNLSRSSHLSMAILMANWALPLQSRPSPTDRCPHCVGAAVSHGLIRAADEMRITAALTIYSKTCKQYFGPKYLVGLIYISTKWDSLPSLRMYTIYSPEQTAPCSGLVTIRPAMAVRNDRSIAPSSTLIVNSH